MWTRPCFTRTGAATSSPKRSTPSVRCSASSAPTRVSRSSSSYSSTLLLRPRWARFGRESPAGYIRLIGRGLPVTTLRDDPWSIVPPRAAIALEPHEVSCDSVFAPDCYISTYADHRTGRLERIGEDHFAGENHPPPGCPRLHGFDRQARPPRLRRGYARQGFSHPPHGGRDRSAGCLQPALGLDARVARGTRAVDIRFAAENVAGRSGVDRRLQV